MSPTHRRTSATATAATTACLLFVLVAGGAAFAGTVAGEAKEANNKKPAEQAETLRKAETKKVCMVNDQLFERDQIPVEVQGKT